MSPLRITPALASAKTGMIRNVTHGVERVLQPVQGWLRFLAGVLKSVYRNLLLFVGHHSFFFVGAVLEMFEDPPASVEELGAHSILFAKEWS